jgi:hypothetical protein
MLAIKCIESFLYNTIFLYICYCIGGQIGYLLFKNKKFITLNKFKFLNYLKGISIVIKIQDSKTVNDDKKEFIMEITNKNPKAFDLNESKEFLDILNEELPSKITKTVILDGNFMNLSPINKNFTYHKIFINNNSLLNDQDIYSLTRDQRIKQFHLNNCNNISSKCVYNFRCIKNNISIKKCNSINDVEYSCGNEIPSRY